MCGPCSQCLGHTVFAPTHGVCAFPVYTAQAPGCSAGELSKPGAGLRSLPRSHPLRFRFSGAPQRHRLGGACVLCPSQVGAAQATWCLASALSPGGQCVLSPPQSQLQREHRLRCAVCLLWGAHLSLRPSWWMSIVQDPRKTWLATGGLLTVWWRMPSLGPSLPLAFQLWLSPACNGRTSFSLFSQGQIFRCIYTISSLSVCPLAES